MKPISIRDQAGTFAEDKDVARHLRQSLIEPALAAEQEVALDFAGVTGATQSFVHSLISDLFRKHGNSVLDRLEFRNCNPTVKKVISIVIDYMQEASGDE